MHLIALCSWSFSPVLTRLARHALYVEELTHEPRFPSSVTMFEDTIALAAMGTGTPKDWSRCILQNKQHTTNSGPYHDLQHSEMRCSFRDPDGIDVYE